MAEAEKSAQPAPAAGQSVETEFNFDEVLSATPKGREAEVSSGVKDLAESIMAGQITWDKSVDRTIDHRIAEIDALMSRQLAAIMHDPKFQELEGTWRGLNYLVMNSETGTDLKIRVINVSKRTLFQDLDKAVEFDQSQIFKKLYEDEFGTPGGTPYGALVGDYKITNHPDDINMLTNMSNVAAASFCPFITSPGPELFGLSSFTELSKPRDLAKIFDDTNYTQWNAFRETEDSRFVTMAMPRVLSRLPYGANTSPIDEFNFEEVDLNDSGKSKTVSHDQYAWMNCAYVLGAQLTDAFAKTGWCTAIRGAENGGKVQGLPCHNFLTDDGDSDLKCPTELAITGRRESELGKIGFMPLSHFKNTDYAVFFGGQSVQKPKKYQGKDGAAATANAAIMARLPYNMAASRIAHYLKVVARDWIGSFMEPSDCEEKMNDWIADYVLADEKAKADQKARFPLAEAKIEVVPIPGAPGSYNAVAHLRPWLQLEELTTSVRMVAEIPKLKSS